MTNPSGEAAVIDNPVAMTLQGDGAGTWAPGPGLDSGAGAGLALPYYAVVGRELAWGVATDPDDQSMGFTYEGITLVMRAPFTVGPGGLSV